MKRVFYIFALLALVAISASAKEKQVKTDYRNALIYAYSPVNSVYEDENIKLEIYNETLWATNKTPKTIFIDLSQCFVIHNGASKPMFDKAQLDERHASKKGQTTSIDEFITIAPATSSGKVNETAIVNMGTGIYGKYSTSETPFGEFTDYDKRLLTLIDEMLTESLNADPKGKEYKGTVARHLTEDESINNIGASIAYAFNKRSEDWHSVSISTWVSDVIFAPYFVQIPKELSKKEKKGFGVKEQESAKIYIKGNSPFEFDQEKSPIIVSDWEGNFKKGTFELNSILSINTKTVSKGRIFGALFTMGLTLANAVKETGWKKKIYFVGANSDWGKMSYANSITNTKQSDNAENLENSDE